MNTSILLNTAYIAPIGYYARIVSGGLIFLESHENYIKQSYRNRSEIYGANGKLQLVIPIKKNNSPKMLIRDVKIDYSTSWKRMHIISIESAYRSSPFYEFYSEDILSVLLKNYNFLFDFNLDILRTVLDILDINKDIQLTEKFFIKDEFDGDDLREFFHPKRKNKIDLESKESIKYTQVFGERHGFISELSILDLLFNLGPESEDYLLNY